MNQWVNQVLIPSVTHQALFDLSAMRTFSGATVTELFRTANAHRRPILLKGIITAGGWIVRLNSNAFVHLLIEGRQAEDTVRISSLRLTEDFILVIDFL